MKLIIGLGNPGKKYQNTRHNIGQILISKLPELPGTKTAITDTFMNESGQSVQKLVHFYKQPIESLYIVHDDLDLPIGEYRVQFDRGAAGHHGVESVIQHLNSQAFWRIRIGIGHPNSIPVESYVLQPFTSEEKVIIDQTIDKIVTDLPNILGL